MIGIAKMPNMLYGTAWKQHRTAELVTQALKAGFRGIDTAAQPRHYQGKAKQLTILAWRVQSTEHGRK